MKKKESKMSDDILTRNEDSELAVRVVSSDGDNGVNKDDVYTRDSAGRLALRTVGAGGGTGGGDVSSVNGKKGAVVLTGQDINSTLSGAGDPVTATVTEHLQTLKNDEMELGNQVSGIQTVIPSDAGERNLLATKSDIKPAAIIRGW